MLYNNPFDMKNCKFFQFKGESLPLSIFAFHVDVTISDTLKSGQRGIFSLYRFLRVKRKCIHHHHRHRHFRHHQKQQQQQQHKSYHEIG